MILIGMLYLFAYFLLQVREIDREAEKSNPFVTKDDIKKMKEL